MLTQAVEWFLSLPQVVQAVHVRGQDLCGCPTPILRLFMSRSLTTLGLSTYCRQ